jgi:SAM-dependent methyltransferase
MTAQPSPTADEAGQYALGHRLEELNRLVDQARFLGDLTDDLLIRAGLGRGMRVLDVGCGAGDVCFLAARIVGPDGWVIGVDNAATAIDEANRRARAADIRNIEFIVGDAATMSPAEPVDALIGRLVLMYLADPAQAVRRLLRHVRPGGVVAFQEFHADATASQPTCATYDLAVERIRQALRRVGSDPNVGLSLWRTFRDAGLIDIGLRQVARVEPAPASASIGLIVRITRTLLPAMEHTAVATAAEVDIDTLADRLAAEISERDAVVVYPPMIDTWARTPVPENLDSRRT